MEDKTVSIVRVTKVYTEKDGSDYFIKEISTYPFITVNQNGDSIYAKDPSKVEQVHVSPYDLGYSRSKKKVVYVRKRLSSDQSISDEWIYFGLPLEFFVDETDPRSKHLWIYTVKSGRVYFTNFEQAITFEGNINDPTMCRRGKAKRLEPDSLLPRNAEIYEQDADGSLQLFVEVNANYE